MCEFAFADTVKYLKIAVCVRACVTECVHAKNIFVPQLTLTPQASCSAVRIAGRSSNQLCLQAPLFDCHIVDVSWL